MPLLVSLRCNYDKQLAICPAGHWKLAPHRKAPHRARRAREIGAPQAVQKTVSGAWRQWTGSSPWPEGKRPMKQLTWLSLAVTGSEGERQWTNVNLAERLWTPRKWF